MKSRFSALVSALAAGAVLLLAFSGIVNAADPTSGNLPVSGPGGKGVCAVQAAAVRPVSTLSLRAFGDCEIDRRLVTLTELANRISSSKVLTSADAATLTAEIGATRAGLNSRKSAIYTEVSLAALRADVTKIVTDYRVYLLVVPQVNLVNGADAVLAAADKFTQVNTNLSARIEAAKAAGKDTKAAQAALDAMNEAVSTAVGLATPLPGKLLALTPAQYDAGTGGPVLAGARADLLSARDDVRAALADAQAARAALK